MFSLKPKGKAALSLWQHLQEIDPDVQCEKRFDWLFLPKEHECHPDEQKVRDALIKHCKDTKHLHPKKALTDHSTMFADKSIRVNGRAIHLDFYLPKYGMAIEYDERQHFTEERSVALQSYPDADFPFSLADWKSRCSPAIQDPDPPYRDWQRAYRDSIRDLRARRHGVKLLRIAHGDYNSEIKRSDCITLIDTHIAQMTS
jgi:hypothetical protein